jgi:sugar phosphate isomerase/epimerase
MRPGFMSSVCPDRTLAQLIAAAEKYGYEGLEFRVDWDHKHGVELSASQDDLAAAQGMLEDSGIEATCIATGVQLNSTDAAEHKKEQESLKRHIELAQGVGARYLRVFGDPVPEEEADRDKALSLAAESCAAVDEHAGQHNAKVLIETHTNMRADWARRIVEDSGATNVGVLWHIGHHVSRGQSVDEAFGHIKGHIDHLHFNTSEGGKVTDADNQRTFDLMKPDGYEGFFSVEVINPDDSEAVLAHHIERFKEFAT